MSSGIKFGAPLENNTIVESIQVNKAAEGRPNGGRSSIGLGFLTFIPLVPFGPQTWTPERYYANATMLEYDFREDLSQAVVKDMMAAGLARSVSYNPFESRSVRNDSANRIDLILKEGSWRRNMTTYCLSIGGVYFWFFGAPVSYGHTDLKFEAVVYAPDGAELGRRTFNSSIKLTEWAYVPHPFPKRLPLLYERISPELRSFVEDCLRKSPSVAASSPASAAMSSEAQSPTGIAEKLSELNKLKDQGLISEEEYQTKRKQIIEAY